MAVVQEDMTAHVVVNLGLGQSDQSTEINREVTLKPCLTLADPSPLDLSTVVQSTVFLPQDRVQVL